MPYQSPELLGQLPEALLKDSYRMMANLPINIDGMASTILALITPRRILHEINIVALRESAKAHIEADFFTSTGENLLSIADYLEEEEPPYGLVRFVNRRQKAWDTLHMLRDIIRINDPAYAASFRRPVSPK